MTSTNQVIEFSLAGVRYCVEVSYVSEVVTVDADDLTEVPNTSRYVEGVVDLRGSTVQIVDPRVLLDVQGGGERGDQVLVFDATHFDGRRFGWRVDDVYRVTSIDPSDIDDSPARDESIRGVVNREDGFVIWASPERALG